ncbi:helix-turn-helix domain-containing protein [Anaerosalibacter massiliensis]|uniref:Helix-turn-helix transcriptional regulator n=1 Tax=Anaerosalibacter massiliensis TaxID=1347392 RepID=A0A9X2S621_9FIRM|nr:helix-turn-helix transcriptional regulator [Anaerosalibacter massiliensis]MCR2045180.1 helix-turn-helix transcriptional regulator [Anaerosalibacter massiliensis]
MNEYEKKKFGKKVKKQLIELEMTQRDLAKKVGVHENYLTDILNGRRSGEKYKDKIQKIIKIKNHQENLKRKYN